METEKIESTAYSADKAQEHAVDHGLVSRELSWLENISFWSILVTAFLLPLVFYMPFNGFVFDFSKKILLFIGAIISLLFWLLARFEDGRLVLPGGVYSKSASLLFLSFILSTLLSPKNTGGFSNSIFGLNFDTDTISVFLALFVLMLLSSVYFQSIKRLSYFYTGILASFLIVFFVQILHFYFEGGLLPGAGMTSNLIGRWNDLGIFFGLCASMSLVAVELVNLPQNSKKFVWIVLALSLLGVSFVNYAYVWFVLGLVSLLVFIYSLFFSGNRNRSGHIGAVAPYSPSFVVIILCLGMFFAQSRTGDFLGKYKIVNVDVRPSFSATAEIIKNTYLEGWRSAVFGAGPNNFSGQWLKHKPNVVNNSVFWNIDFNVGIGRLPSYLVTMGLLGALSWIFFLGSIFYLGFKTVLYSSIPKSSRFIVFVSLVASVYLWVFSLVYVPDTVIFALTFILTGVLVACLVRSGAVNNFEVSFLKDPRIGFISVLILVVLVVAVLSGGFSLYNKFTANFLFQRGLHAMNSGGDFDSALSTIKSAIEYDSYDIYYRTLSEINLIKLSQFISEKKTMNKDSISSLQQMIVDSSAAARKAIEINQGNYLNWVALGRVAEAVVPLGVVEGSYDLAVDSYRKALELNPKNPNILLNLARLEIANNSIEKAKDYLNDALEIKGNFTAALYLLSQIEASQGNLPGAISKAEKAYIFAPDDLGVLFQLGFLKFSNKDYEGAINILERAESLNPQYSNAKYFLGLSYAKVGKNSQAIKQFRDISALNPDNDEVKSIINNLLQGKDPFAAAVSVKEETVKKGKLPVRE